MTNYYITEDDLFSLEDFIKNNNIKSNDTIELITNNQEGYKKYLYKNDKIILIDYYNKISSTCEKNKKKLKKQ